MCYKPKTIKDCRDNIDKAVAVCEQVGRIRENMSPSLLANKELILKGDHATTWGILNSLRKLYPEAIPRENQTYYLVPHIENGLPYTLKELVVLEASLLRWMTSCGVLNNYKHAPSSLLEIEEDLKNGVIY